MENYTVGLELNSGTRPTINGIAVRDERNLVLKPIDYPSVISISISESRDSARLLTDERKVVEANVGFLKSWRWNSEIHIYQSQDDVISIRGDDYTDHYMVSNCKYTQVVIDSVSIFVDMDTGAFTLTSEGTKRGFQGATVREDDYYTHYDDNQHITVGFSSNPNSISINEKKSDYLSDYN